MLPYATIYVCLPFVAIFYSIYHHGASQRFTNLDEVHSDAWAASFDHVQRDVARGFLYATFFGAKIFHCSSLFPKQPSGEFIRFMNRMVSMK